MSKYDKAATASAFFAVVQFIFLLCFITEARLLAAVMCGVFTVSVIVLLAVGAAVNDIKRELERRQR